MSDKYRFFRKENLLLDFCIAAVTFLGLIAVFILKLDGNWQIGLNVAIASAGVMFAMSFHLLYFARHIMRSEENRLADTIDRDIGTINRDLATMNSNLSELNQKIATIITLIPEAKLLDTNSIAGVAMILHRSHVHSHIDALLQKGGTTLTEDEFYLILRYLTPIKL